MRDSISMEDSKMSGSSIQTAFFQPSSSLQSPTNSSSSSSSSSFSCGFSSSFPPCGGGSSCASSSSSSSYSSSTSTSSSSVPSSFPSSSHLCDASVLTGYFQYYSKLSNQMNMLQDQVRTSAYFKAISTNRSDFAGRIVMDVGAGSGILSFFAAQAGAQKVYAVEGSSSSAVIHLIKHNSTSFDSVVDVINCTLEHIQRSTNNATSTTSTSLPPSCSSGSSFSASSSGSSWPLCSNSTLVPVVDVLVSEPLGTFLFNERMVESYLYARDAFLKPGGKMFPNMCHLAIAPFSDQCLYNEVCNRPTFWTNTDFYGVDLSPAVDLAREELFRQPIVEYIDPALLLCPAHIEKFDLATIDRDALKFISFPFEFEIRSASLVHGLAGWFDVLFEGSDNCVAFSTSPYCPATHWYQIRFLFEHPLACNPGQIVCGKLDMTANDQQSYLINIYANIKGTNIYTKSTNINLKDPEYRYFTNPAGSYFPATSKGNVAAGSVRNPNVGTGGPGGGPNASCIYNVESSYFFNSQMYE